MVNSTWTKNHIETLWGVRAKIVYPPCDTSSITSSKNVARDEGAIVSIAQFRPEKRHDIQVLALALAKDRKIRLICVGGVRNAADSAIANGVRTLALELDVADRVRVVENAAWNDIVALLNSSGMGIHTMTDEHFGIGVVEYMAGGAITIAHDSGGPASDIVVPYNSAKVGFRATEAQEFADCIDVICALTATEKESIRRAARDSVMERFSTEVFEREFGECISAMLQV